MAGTWRRREPRRTGRPDSDAGVLPLINVVFLLLIFFMLTGQFASEGPLPIRPTESQSEAEPGDRDLVVVVGPDGAVVAGTQPIGLDDLPALLAASGEDRSTVWLKPDADAEAVRVIDVLHAIREAGVAEVRLLTVLAL